MTKKKEIDTAEKNIEDYQKMQSALQDLKNVTSVYYVKTEPNITTNKLSCGFYVDNLIMAAVMESFYSGNERSFKDINMSIRQKIPKWIWRLKLSLLDIHKSIYKLSRLGFIQLINVEDKYNPKYKMTVDGVKALQNQTFQNLAATSFFSYQTYIMNRKSFWLTIFMLIVTIMSVIVTIISLNKPT